MLIPEDLRTLTLLDWLENDLLLEVENIAPASSDASFRRYFRVQTPDGSLIVMDAPPDKENTAPFIKVAGLMANANVPVPVSSCLCHCGRTIVPVPLFHQAIVPVPVPSCQCLVP
jgi:aminoglycoside/choline kinase family phosphotransferase